MDIDWTPTNTKLRQFGWICLLGFGLLGGVARWLWELPLLGDVFFVIGPLLTVVGLVHAPALRYVFIGMSVVSLPIGFVVSHLLLGVLYYLVLTPIGLIMRLAGKDPLRLKGDRNALSYWVERQPPGPAPDSMPNQF